MKSKGRSDAPKATLPELSSKPVTDEQHDQIEKYLEQEIRSASPLSAQDQRRIDKSYSENGDDDVAGLIRSGMSPLREPITVYRGEALDEVGDGLMSVTFSENTARNFGRVRKIELEAGTPVYSPRSGISGGEILVDPRSLNDGAAPDAQGAASRGGSSGDDGAGVTVELPDGTTRTMTELDVLDYLDEGDEFAEMIGLCGTGGTA